MNTTGSRNEWRNVTIALNGPKGPSSWPGKEFGDTGLGYWIGRLGAEQTINYTPTHLASTRRIGFIPFSDEETCQHFIEAVQALADWHQDSVSLKTLPALQTQVGELYKRFMFEDAAATAGGGEW